MKAFFLAIFVLLSVQLYSQSFNLASVIDTSNNKGKITGTVYDQELNAEPLGFAEVMVKGTSFSTDTNIDGYFSISLKPGTYTLIFKFIGYKTTEVQNIKVESNTTTNYNQILNPLEIESPVFVAQNAPKLN